MKRSPSTLIDRTFLATTIAVAALTWLYSVTLADSPLVEPARIVWGFQSGIAFSSPRGIAIDAKRQEVIVANTGRNCIDIFSLKGRPLQRHMHQVRRPDGVIVDGFPTGLAIDGAGRLLVVDRLADYVDVIDFRGRSLGEIALPVGEAGAVTVGPDGRVWVANRGDMGRVYVFSPEYELLGQWGDSGREPGQLSQISALAIAPDGNVVIACLNTQVVIQIFSPAGKYLNGFGEHDIGPGNFSFPSGLAITDDGRIWVTDEIRLSVQVFDPEGNRLGAFGGGGIRPGNFMYPSSIATDGSAHLAVIERVGSRFQILDVLETSTPRRYPN